MLCLLIYRAAHRRPDRIIVADPPWYRDARNVADRRKVASSVMISALGDV